MKYHYRSFIKITKIKNKKQRLLRIKSNKKRGRFLTLIKILQKNTSSLISRKRFEYAIEKQTLNSLLKQKYPITLRTDRDNRYTTLLPLLKRKLNKKLSTFLRKLLGIKSNKFTKLIRIKSNKKVTKRKIKYRYFKLLRFIRTKKNNKLKKTILNPFTTKSNNSYSRLKKNEGNKNYFMSFLKALKKEKSKNKINILKIFYNIKRKLKNNIKSFIIKERYKVNFKKHKLKNFFQNLQSTLQLLKRKGRVNLFYLNLNKTNLLKIKNKKLIKKHLGNKINYKQTISNSNIRTKKLYYEYIKGNKKTIKCCF